MKPNHRPALTDDWWRTLKSRADVQKAIGKTLAVHMAEIIEQQFAREDSDRYIPRNWTQLSNDLCINREQIVRKRDGSTAFRHFDELGIAAVFGISPAALRPDSLEDWLDGIAGILASSFSSELSPSATSVFVSYCLTRVRHWPPATGPLPRNPATWSLDEDLLASVAKALGDDTDLETLKRDVLRIAAAIENPGAEQ